MSKPVCAVCGTDKDVRFVLTRNGMQWICHRCIR